jgi:hypothetical protein
LQRTLILAGREIVTGVLGQPMDGAFDRLHSAYLGNAALPWEEFTTAALRYFDDNAGASTAHDAYFNTFTVIWTSLMGLGRMDEAEHVWEQALKPAQEWEQAHPGQRLHKGTPYYFWAMTALLRGDTDRGYLLIHQSVDEDIQTSGESRPNTPGYALVSLNFNQVNQLFRPWVVAQAAFFNLFIADYSATYRRPLTIDEVKGRFIDRLASVDTIFLLTYTLARLKKLAELPSHMTNNGFAGQVQMDLLFDITLVIDAAIKEKNAPEWKFSKHAGRLLVSAGHQLEIEQLREINQRFKDNFDATLQAAINGTLTVDRNTALNRLQCDVALAYGLRNRGAHNIGTPPTLWQRFHALQQALFRVLFATVDFLY